MCTGMHDVTSVVSGRSVPGAIGLTVPKFYILTRKHNQKRSSPSRFSMHLPVLDGRYQPALKIDMTEERGCAAVEGEHAEIRGRWRGSVLPRLG